MEYKSTILIVDDNLAGRETLKGLLYGQGYNLAFASNGLDALELAENLTPDLILLDVMMPGMDGYEVCERLRAMPVVAEVPVIMVTALEDRDSRLRGIEAGADDFVSKPFDHAELRKRVQTITRLNRYRRLLSERTKFEWVVEQADDGYLTVNHNDIIGYINSQARLYLNLSADDNLQSTTFLELAKRQYNCEPFTAWSVWPTPPTAALPRYLVQPATATTNAFWLQVDIVDMNPGSLDEHLVRLRDISPKVAEQRSMWTFHGQISHKLRTPLNHLFASMDMITEADLACTDADIRTFFSIAKQGATRLKNDLQDILQYIDTPHIAGDGVDGCLLAELPRIIETVRSYLDIKTVNVHFDDIDSADPIVMVVARPAIELILWELMDNAKKFHPANSPQLDIKVSVAGQYLALEVNDDGIHLSPFQLEKMWAPYYQAEKYFTGQVRGAGLGLAIITSILWGAGGACTAHNRIDHPGIVIKLKIPLIPVPQK